MQSESFVVGEATILVVNKSSWCALLDRLTDTVLNSTLMIGLMFGSQKLLVNSPAALPITEAPPQNEQPVAPPINLFQTLLILLKFLFV